MNGTRQIAALVVAAGRGSRAGDGLPKQYRVLGGRPVLAHVLDAFMDHPAVGAVCVVIDAADEALFREAAGDHAARIITAHGGATRQASVAAGLAALGGSAKVPGIVLVHDGARPFVSHPLIDRAIGAIEAGHAAAVPGVAVTDTIKLVDGGSHVTETPDRSALRAIQTPQAFAFDALVDAHRAAAFAGTSVTDDAGVMEAAGHPVLVFEGDPGNIKLTYPADFEAAERRLGTPAMPPALDDIRIGQGYDVHAFGPGDHVMLGGIRIPHGQGVIAHSDGDVVLHAATDALLGAIADGDIGTHFPPSDPRWRGAASDQFLAHAAMLITKRGGRVAHLDITVVCEAPKVGPHRDAIRARIGEILGIGPDRVAIKATTSEKMGFTGRREGLAALAIATVRLPGA
ncbi:bifunctional 2-C-methyl-D-erythritol 4-phosphate cytidylyltransferase/2-C-methyl-D-erythritol 2,4-cyclodiphosphate synthase [Phreatobacter aquaticus]|uniref:Bifunctional enzyme IspD/IspF n=1 Tax=Phreatobacter aquaticus TaxID=2570229 RepID=A0A4D7QPJ4_9HYPH|nr:bifunctional 2-C-methyl-D-erythritol 4-phosphate cytidylyltransferase/2-C-methyl-D-erythritol 2,4-cyclodiphosphate synthase [Phreatobacter aquaticus]QCK87479.1 bifunctional 2-C-methyl-D-erythritol 4-phosphate cytidylyltransferase/2-C-methyl-D-erythritol 2,4-cyclodiphosphate synthase [Phreatobacter aquaticus]